ncbi:MAG: transcription antitermination factor NusB [Lachnospiraceae bacterium]|nr:transcription antitermination factor NusB [Lachnospiraceae bacterium]
MSTKLSKRQFRIEVFKGVFLKEFYSGEDINNQLDEMYNQDIQFEEIEISDKDATLIVNKCKDIFDNIDKIDELISTNLDKWTINRIGKVELALLRVAVYEYKYDGLDAAIVINEAVDIAKMYGGDKSGSFINGVLAKIVKA